MLPNEKPQQILLTISSIGQTVTIDQETDKLYKSVRGINVVQTDPNAQFSTLQFKIDEVEIFPENWEIIRIKYKEAAPFGYDYYPISQPAGGSRIKGTYIDRGNGVTYPYNVTISLMLVDKV
ncbi:MAG: hypothetical protein ACXVPQ_05420 [Bacteroidia bacterium]